MKRFWVCIDALAALLVVGSEISLAQARQRSQTVIFPPTANFQNPGARALGLGGAFTSLADDASASELNPAGLTQLKHAELSVEYRRIENVAEVRYPNSIPFSAFECGFLGSPVDACRHSFRSRLDSLSFVSLIVPTGKSGTLAFYRHELDREKLSLLRPQLDFVDRVAEGSIETLDRRIVRTGLAFAYAFADQISIGVSVNSNSMTQSFNAVQYYTNFDGGPPTFVSVVQDAHIGDHKVGGTAGIHWRPIRLISLGVFYSSRVEFEERGLRQACPFDPLTGLPICFFSGDEPDPGNLYFSDEVRSSFTLPSRIGGSLALRPTSWLLFVGEADRVSYSDNDQEIIRFDAQSRPIGLDLLRAKDIWETHVGLEVVVPVSRSWLIAGRAGYWHDPDHSFRYAGCRATTTRVPCDPDPFFTETNPPIGRRDHLAGGIGVAWSWGQLDVGYDWIRQTRTGTLAVSVVVRGK